MKITVPFSAALAAGSAIAADTQPEVSSSSTAMSGTGQVEVKTLRRMMPPHRRITVTHPKRGEEGVLFKTFDPATTHAGLPVETSSSSHSVTRNRHTFAPFPGSVSKKARDVDGEETPDREETSFRLHNPVFTIEAGPKVPHGPTPVFHNDRDEPTETAAATESPVVTVTNLTFKTVIVPDTTATTSGSEMTSELTSASTTDAALPSWFPLLWSNIDWFPSLMFPEEASTSTAVAARDNHHTMLLAPTPPNGNHRFPHQATPLPTPRAIAPRDPKHKKKGKKSKHSDDDDDDDSGVFTTRGRPVPFGAKFEDDYGTPDDECSPAWKDTLQLNFPGDHIRLEHEMANICGNRDWKDHVTHECYGFNDPDEKDDESLCTMKRR